MKFTCIRKELASALHAMTGVVNAANHNLQPILANVKLSVMTDGRLVLSATDLNTGIICVIETKGSEQGKTLVNFSRFFEIVKEYKDDNFTFTADEKEAVISDGGTCFVLPVEEWTKYPEIGNETPPQPIWLDYDVAMEMIQRTIFCTTPEKTRYDLDAVKIIAKDGKLEAAATDGKRLALFETTCEVGASLDLCVYAGCLATLKNALKSMKTDKVGISATETKIYLTTKDFVLFTRLTDVKFPPYRKILPKSLKHTLTFADKFLFASALRKAKIAKDRSSEGTFVVLNIDKNQVVCKLESAIARASVFVAATYDGEPTRLKFDLGFLAAAAEIYADDRLMTLHTNGDGESPLRFVDTDEKYTWTHIVLPIKDQSEEKETG